MQWAYNQPNTFYLVSTVYIGIYNAAHIEIFLHVSQYSTLKLEDRIINNKHNKIEDKISIFYNKRLK